MLDNVNHKPEFINNSGEICPMKLVQTLVAGKWKILILWYLREKPRRFGELNKLLPNTSRGVLTQQLKQLEEDKLVNREVYNEVPPKVVYSLTNMGENFNKVLDVMQDFGEVYLKEVREDKI